MGLDSYLYGKKYFSGYSFEPSETQKEFQGLVRFAGAEGKTAKSSFSAEIQLTFAYWRKSNQIHKFFVSRCQNGMDDCGTYYAPREILQELVSLCKIAITSKSGSLLPTESGFFFGSTNYDEYYFRDLEDTIRQIEPLLKDDMKNWEFYYHSSW